jgi:hypothetical protein
MRAKEYMTKHADPDIAAMYLDRFNPDILPTILDKLADEWTRKYHSLPEVRESVEGASIEDLMKRYESDKQEIRTWMIEAGLNNGVEALKSF